VSRAATLGFPRPALTGSTPSIASIPIPEQAAASKKRCFVAVGSFFYKINA
jgi:hypothetical protein